MNDVLLQNVMKESRNSDVVCNNNERCVKLLEIVDENVF